MWAMWTTCLVPRRRARTNWPTLEVLEIRGRCIVKRNSAKCVCAIEVQRAELGFAQPRCIRQDGLEHRLQVTGQTGDDVQHLRGRRLLLQRLGKLAPESRIFLSQVAGGLRRFSY